VRVRVLGLLIIALTLAACTSSPTVAKTTTTTSSTTTTTTTVSNEVQVVEWVPVAYGDAQISVPATFSVFYPDQIGVCSFPSQSGSLWIAPSLPSAHTGLTCGRPHSNTDVVLAPMSHVPQPYSSEKPTILKNVPVYVGANGVTVISYYAPSVGVEVRATGPMARQIVRTLTRSPRAVALASGPAPKVPSSWHSVTFAGLRFSVPAPAVWPINRTSGGAYGLGTPCVTPGVAFPDNTGGLLSSGVTLSTDLHLLPPPSCAAETDDAPPQPPMNGVQVDSGRRVQFQVTLSFSTHCLDLHGLSACPATSPSYSILVLRVTVPGRTKPVLVSIGLAGTKPVFMSLGLAGNGVIARTILYSLRPA
jgi:hypothetical protein